MSLLKITTTPIEYEIKIEKAKLRLREQTYDEIKKQEADILKKEKSAKSRANPEIVNQARQGEKTSADFRNLAMQRTAGRVKATSASAVAQKNVSENSGEFVSQIGEFLAQTNEGIDFVTQSGGAKQTQFRENSKSDTVEFLENITEKRTILRDNQWQISKKKLEFVPGRFKMDIIQYPKVDIEYIPEKSDKENNTENGENK